MPQTIYRQEFSPVYCTGAVSCNKVLSVHTFWVFHIVSISMIRIGLVILLELGFLVDLSLFWICSPHPFSNFRSFSTEHLFVGWGYQPNAQHTTRRTRISLLVWVITFDLSGMVCPTSSYSTTSITLRIIWARKPHHYIIVGIHSEGV
jgi:hypothetical protein